MPEAWLCVKNWGILPSTLGVHGVSGDRRRRGGKGPPGVCSEPWDKSWMKARGAISKTWKAVSSKEHGWSQLVKCPGMGEGGSLSFAVWIQLSGAKGAGWHTPGIDPGRGAVL